MEITEAAFSFSESSRSSRFGPAGCVLDNDQQYGTSPVAQKVGRDIWAPLPIPLCHIPGLPPNTVTLLDAAPIILVTTELPGKRNQKRVLTSKLSEYTEIHA